MTPQGVAAGGAAEKAYPYYAQLSADAAHPTIEALDRYVRDVNGVFQVNIEPVADAGEMSETVNLACEALIGVCVAVTDLLQIAPYPELPALIEEIVRRSAE